MENYNTKEKLFSPVPRYTERSNGSRGKKDNVKEPCFSAFLETIEKTVKEKFKTGFYKIRVLN